MPELIGYVLAIDAIITWSLASLVYKAGLEKTNPKATLLFRLCCVSIGTLLFSLFFALNFWIFISSSGLNRSELTGYLIACLISGLSVTIGDLTYFLALKKIDASRAFPITQLSLVFVYPVAYFMFGEEITISILIGGFLILSSVFFLSAKDKPEQDENIFNKEDKGEDSKEDVTIGIALSLISAFLWAISIIAFHQARIISGDVFVTNFIRIIFATAIIAVVGIFQREYYLGFRKEERENLRYYLFIGLAGSLSLGLADSLFYKAAEINGLILTSAITASTPVVQQVFSIAILKEKFRKKFIIALILIILGNYIIIFYY